MNFGADFENTVRRNKPLSRGALIFAGDIVYGCYRGNYTSYNRDVRLATAVKDKYPGVVVGRYQANS